MVGEASGATWRRRAILRCGALVAALVVWQAGSGSAQVPKSQLGMVLQRIAHTDVTITYSRPVARGRRLFGGIVPYREPWNPGADAATTIRFSGPVELAGHQVPGGTYSVWIIPDTTAWTLILSAAANVPHTPYPKGQDVLRLRLSPVRGEQMETLGFYFPMVDGDSATLRMHWGETILPISVRAP